MYAFNCQITVDMQESACYLNTICYIQTLPVELMGTAVVLIFFLMNLIRGFCNCSALCVAFFSNVEKEEFGVTVCTVCCLRACIQTYTYMYICLQYIYTHTHTHTPVL